MGLQYGTTLRNAQLDAIESTIGTAPKLRLYSGSPPANCAAAACVPLRTVANFF